VASRVIGGGGGGERTSEQKERETGGARNKNGAQIPGYILYLFLLLMFD